jgi:hypothetical protein
MPVLSCANGGSIHSRKHELHHGFSPCLCAVLLSSEFIVTAGCQALCLWDTGISLPVSPQESCGTPQI